MTSRKTASFAIVHMTVAFAVVWLLTGSWAIGGVVALIEPAINTMAYFFHEKFWERAGQRRLRNEPSREGVVANMSACSNCPLSRPNATPESRLA